jgi:hypothetical protein
VADYEDPGWGGAIRGILWLIPIFHLAGIFHSARLRRTAVDLVALRRHWLNIFTSMFSLLIAFAFVAPWDGGRSRWTLAIVAAIAAIGVGNVYYVSRLQRRPLPLGSEEQLGASYRALFFISLGASVVPMLFALCAILVEKSFWIGLVGLPFTIACFAIFAPTRKNIERRQQEIRTSGSPLSLGQALMDSTPPGRN